MRPGERFHLFIQVSVQHVFAGGDPQGSGHGVSVKGRVQSHHSSMNPFTLKVVCKLLKNTHVEGGSVYLHDADNLRQPLEGVRGCSEPRDQLC